MASKIKIRKLKLKKIEYQWLVVASSCFNNKDYNKL